MMSSSGIRAFGSGSDDYVIKITMRRRQSWSLESQSHFHPRCLRLLEDSQRNGEEPVRIAIVNNADDAPEKKAEVDIRLAEIRYI